MLLICLHVGCTGHIFGGDGAPADRPSDLPDASCPECTPAPSVCGDGACGAAESCGTCAEDCGDCPTLQPGAPSLGGCELLPANNILNTVIAGAPVHARSAEWIARMREVSGPHPGAGASAAAWMGSRGGIPVNIGGVARTLSLDGSYGQPTTAFTTVMPTAPRMEGEPNPAGAWDMHVLVIDPEPCELLEHIHYRYDVLRQWLTGGSVRWDLSSNSLSTPIVPGGAAAEAAGLPMVPLIYRYDEVAAGEVRHPLRIAGDSIHKGTFLWPARSSDGRDENENAMPMGARIRLRAGTDLSGLGPQARVIAEALKTYGMIVADSTGDGQGWGLGGEGDERWDDADLATLSTLDLADFDVVDVEGWKVSDDSLAAEPR
ncbi:MAG: hypothetical protein R3A78_15715 [Polyangiales bacterium]|nr:hypothetical protein [Myxococcales bacterium]